VPAGLHVGEERSRGSPYPLERPGHEGVRHAAVELDAARVVKLLAQSSTPTRIWPRVG
jgi:hypothetical protein